MEQKNVLIVEDEVSLTKVLIDKFTKEGYLATGAYDGKEGLKMALKDHPDAILLDIAMPVMDGVEMLKKLRADKWGQNALVIMLTNFSDFNNIQEVEELGIAEYLVKSDWGLEDVVKKVSENLNK